jgi:ferritin-like metal-binding protein YciE
MSDEQKKTYLAWLNDAHAMEMGLVKMLEKQTTETKDTHPELSAKIAAHLEETKQHASLVEAVITRMGSSPSVGKDFLSQASTVLGGLTASLPEDSMVKNVHGSYASEQFEIATYTLLTAAAEEVGDTESVSIFQRILDEEIEMANFLIEQLQAATREYIQSLV